MLLSRIKRIVEEQQDQFRCRFFTLSETEAIAKKTIRIIKSILKDQGRPVPIAKEKKGKKKPLRNKSTNDSDSNEESDNPKSLMDSDDEFQA